MKTPVRPFALDRDEGEARWFSGSRTWTRATGEQTGNDAPVLAALPADRACLGRVMFVHGDRAGQLVGQLVDENALDGLTDRLCLADSTASQNSPMICCTLWAESNGYRRLAQRCQRALLGQVQPSRRSRT
jgi:hypothetical protein